MLIIGTNYWQLLVIIVYPSLIMRRRSKDPSPGLTIDSLTLWRCHSIIEYGSLTQKTGHSIIEYGSPTQKTGHSTIECDNKSEKVFFPLYCPRLFVPLPPQT